MGKKERPDMKTLVDMGRDKVVDYLRQNLIPMKGLEGEEYEAAMDAVVKMGVSLWMTGFFEGGKYR